MPFDCQASRFGGYDHAAFLESCDELLSVAVHLNEYCFRFFSELLHLS